MISQLRRLVVNLSASTRRRLLVALGGSLVVSMAEVIGLLTVLPLVQLLSETDPDSAFATRWLAQAAGTDDTEVLIQVAAVVMLVAFLFKGIASVAIRWWSLGFIYREESATSQMLLRYYVAAPYRLHLQRGSADFIRTMNDSVSVVFNLVVVGLVGVLTEATSILLITGTLLVVLPLPTLGFVLYFAVIGLSILRLSRSRTVKYGKVMTEGSLATYKSAMHIFGAIKEVKVRNDPSHLIGQYAQAKDRFASARQRASFFGELPKYVLEIFFISGLAVATVVLIARYGVGQTLPLIAFLVAAGFRIMPSIARLLGAISGIRVGLSALDLVVVDMEASRALGEVTPARPDPITIHESVSLEHVCFRYGDDQDDVLTDVDLRIPVGTSIALVGMSGAGKTTLVDVLLGLHRPTKGRVLVDGTDVRTRLPSWQSSIGLVPQEVYVLDDSIRANVAFGDPPGQVDEERLQAAVSQAQLEAVLRDMPGGLDTIVGERGSRLSGGQRQRIGIARALYRNPQLLVLDEATSSLDSETESRITSTIRALAGELTVVVVAHRLSTVRDCDQVVFLEGGRVASVGTFDEVREENPSFAWLVKLGTLDASAAS